MKKMTKAFVLVIQFFVSIVCIAQPNVFPTSGNAIIGSSTAGSTALAIERNNSDGATNTAVISIKNTNTAEPAGNFYNVAGSNYFAGNDQVLGQIVANYGIGTASPWSYGSGFYITTRTNHPIVFTTGTENTERLRITASGNIGIGTNNPQSKLAVNGDIFSRKVKVTQTGWPDYVFAPGYRLLSLDHLERFIAVNKHLPGIPDAKNVEKNGLDLGDNQAALLMKLEEMTLYIIEQNKRIKALEEVVKEMQSGK